MWLYNYLKVSFPWVKIPLTTLLLCPLKFVINVFHGISIIIELATGSCHKRQKAQAPTLRAPIRNRRTRKVAKAKVHNRNTNLT